MANILMVRNGRPSQLVLHRVPVAGDFILMPRARPVRVTAVGLIAGGARDAEVIVEEQTDGLIFSAPSRQG
jgi:hypothetical protein